MAPTRQKPAAFWPGFILGGAVAQLGERLVRNEEVRGSTPLGSTSLRSLRELRLGRPKTRCMKFPLRHGRAWPFEERRRYARLCPGHLVGRQGCATWIE